MKVAEIMHSGVASVHQDLPLREVAQALIGWRVSGAPVVDPAGCPVGVVTLADLVAHAAGLDRASSPEWSAPWTSCASSAACCR